MDLKETLTAAEHATLPEALQALYTADGEGFKWSGPALGTGTLRASLDTKDRKLGEKDAEIGNLTTRLADLETKFKGIDPADYIEAKRKLGELETGKLLSQGDYEAALAAKQNEWDTERKRLEEELDGEKTFNRGLLVDNRLHSVLTKGLDADKSTKIPSVRPELLDGLLAYIHSQHTPDVIVAGKDRQAVVHVDGKPVPLDSWAFNWLKSKEAEGWVKAVENSGDISDDKKVVVKPGESAPESTEVVTIPASERSANLEALAAGTAVSES